MKFVENTTYSIIRSSGSQFPELPDWTARSGISGTFYKFGKMARESFQSGVFRYDCRKSKITKKMIFYEWISL